MSVSCECCVLAGRGLCDALIASRGVLPKKKTLESYNRSRHVEIHVNSQCLGYSIQSRTLLSAGPSRVGYIPIL